MAPPLRGSLTRTACRRDDRVQLSAFAACWAAAHLEKPFTTGDPRSRRANRGTPNSPARVAARRTCCDAPLAWRPGSDEVSELWCTNARGFGQAPCGVHRRARPRGTAEIFSGGRAQGVCSFDWRRRLSVDSAGRKPTGGRLWLLPGARLLEQRVRDGGCSARPCIGIRRARRNCDESLLRCPERGFGESDAEVWNAARARPRASWTPRVQDPLARVAAIWRLTDACSGGSFSELLSGGLYGSL